MNDWSVTERIHSDDLRPVGGGPDWAWRQGQRCAQSRRMFTLDQSFVVDIEGWLAGKETKHNHKGVHCDGPLLTMVMVLTQRYRPKRIDRNRVCFCRLEALDIHCTQCDTFTHLLTLAHALLDADAHSNISPIVHNVSVCVGGDFKSQANR